MGVIGLKLVKNLFVSVCRPVSIFHGNFWGSQQPASNRSDHKILIKWEWKECGSIQKQRLFTFKLKVAAFEKCCSVKAQLLFWRWMISIYGLCHTARRFVVQHPLCSTGNSQQIIATTHQLIWKYTFFTCVWRLLGGCQPVSNLVLLRPKA